LIGGVALLALAVPTVTAWSLRAPRAGSVPVPVPAKVVTPPPAGHDHSGHEDAEGLKLVAQTAETVTAASHCRPDAPVRRFDVVAIDVDITLNRYGDHDPDGRMYALESQVDAIRGEERRNRDARAAAVADADPAVSTGEQGDAIQPLTLRARPGECVRIHLRNALEGEDASFHLHGSSLTVDGRPATAAEKAARVAPGTAATYEWQIFGDEPEGTHYFHSHGPHERAQASHGLFGALIVEPPGSTWVDPLDASKPATGWDAIIRQRNGPAFREFALYYHEVGDETFQARDRDGAFVPLVDDITRAYRPDGRAINYRSEPFLNRLRLGRTVTGRADESLEYSSYAFGDPATPVMRSYLGDPVKQRVVHAGSETFHVHHVHGGSIRWRRQPGVEPSAFDRGIDKHPVLTPAKSERTDSQTLGPSESFDVTDECGSGGCQGSAGDFLYHCHVAHHYFAGMWGIWRVYNTLQEGASSTDTMPPLAPLPDRLDRVRPAVTSAGLDAAHGGTADAIERQLPPPGARLTDADATVYDWARDANGVYLGEPETAAVWPGYRSATPGARRPLLFDPATGRLAYPFLRPHLALRPPFAPGHGPAPFLDPVLHGHDPPPPGANGPTSVCPSGTTPVPLAINAVNQSVTLNAKQGLVDADGQLYVRRDQEDSVRRDPSLQTPLVVRARAGRDCVDVLLRSELRETSDVPYSKVGLHIHFVQFDVQGSDGLDTGYNFEQTVRPFRAEGTELVGAGAPAGATAIEVTDTSGLRPGVLLGIGLDRDREFETAQVVAVGPGGRVALDGPLRFDHGAGEVVGTEFVRYRWYPDAQFGTSYFHDHVNALSTWTHGLFGALVAEPPDATWTDPHTGRPLASGAVADIHTAGRTGVDVRGAFRELVLLTQDDNPLTHVGRATGSTYNLRAEPLAGRGGPPSLLFNSDAHGDPATPLLEANLGDPVVIRSLVGAANEIHTTHIEGHWFRVEPWSATSPPVSTVRVGISERFDLAVRAAGGPQRMPGDYLYFNGRPSKLREGSWGLVRVYGPGDGGLRALPGHERVPAPATTVCPPGAPERRFDVAAVDAPLPMLDGDNGKAYLLEHDVADVRAGRRAVEPLVLHVSVGDCLVVRLRNATAGGRVSYSCDLLAADPSSSGGAAAGHEPDQSVPPGATRTYRYYASPEVGESVSVTRDWGDIVGNSALGLYGAVIVGPRGASYRDPVTGADASSSASTAVDVFPAERDQRPWRDFTLLFHDSDDSIGTHRMPYTNDVRGTTAVNYRAAPDVPPLSARAGDPVRLHVVAPWSEQAQVFSLEGHRWPLEPGLRGTPLRSSQAIAGGEALTLRVSGGAGGEGALPGTYRWEDHRLPYAEAGLWGELRVAPARSPSAGVRLEPLSAAGGRSTPARLAAALAVVLALAAGVVFVTVRRRQGTSPNTT
jgi:FtsP/CotA-like multicopper oxidase with cupredoxin domain